MAKYFLSKIKSNSFFWSLVLLPVFFVSLIIFVPFLYVLFSYGDFQFSFMNERIKNIIYFTLYQAFFSSFLSVLGGLLASLCLYATALRGKKYLFSLSIIPFSLPSIVVAMAFVFLLGSQGIGTQILSFFHLKSPMHSTTIIIMAHLFFNLPFCMRVFYSYLKNIPQEYIHSCMMLNFSFYKIIKEVIFLELFKPVLSMFLLVFVFCLNSFAIPLLLGGGPAYTTTEVAIYQFVRSGFSNLSSACMLGVIQILLTSVFIFLYACLKTDTKSSYIGKGSSLLLFSHYQSFSLKFFFKFIVFLFVLFLILPFMGIVVDAFSFSFFSWEKWTKFAPQIQKSIQLSLILALSSAFLVTLVSWLFCYGSAKLQDSFPKTIEFLKILIFSSMIFSPTILAFSWLLFSYEVSRVHLHEFFIVMLIHSVLSLPICVRILMPAVESFVSCYEKSIQSLHLPVYKALFKVYAPSLFPFLVLCFGISFAFSFGEFAVSAMFSRQQFQTLPLLIQELSGRYEYELAAFLSFVLAFLCGVLLFIGEQKNDSSV